MFLLETLNCISWIPTGLLLPRVSEGSTKKVPQWESTGFSLCPAFLTSQGWVTHYSSTPPLPRKCPEPDPAFQDLQGAQGKDGEGLFTSHTSSNIRARQAGPSKRAQQDEQLFQKPLGHPYFSLPLGVMFPAAATFLKSKHKCLQEDFTLGFRSTLLRRRFH